MGNHNWNKELDNIGDNMKRAKTQQNDPKNTKIAWILMMVSIGVLLMAHGSDANSIFIGPLVAGAIFHVAKFFAEECAPKLVAAGLGLAAAVRVFEAFIISISYGRDFWEPFLIIFVAGAIYFAMGYGLGTFLMIFVRKK